MDKPSTHWLNELWKVAQSAHSETGMSFMAYIESLCEKNHMYADSKYDDYKLVRAFSRELGEAFIGIDNATLGGDYTVVIPEQMVDHEKSLNEG